MTYPQTRNMTARVFLCILYVISRKYVIIVSYRYVYANMYMCNVELANSRVTVLSLLLLACTGVRSVGTTYIICIYLPILPMHVRARIHLSVPRW